MVRNHAIKASGENFTRTFGHPDSRVMSNNLINNPIKLNFTLLKKVLKTHPQNVDVIIGQVEFSDNPEFNELDDLLLLDEVHGQ